MVSEKHSLLLNYEKAKREVDRILQGPIPAEALPKQHWQHALDEAKLNRDCAEKAYNEEEIPSHN